MISFKSLKILRQEVNTYEVSLWHFYDERKTSRETVGDELSHISSKPYLIGDFRFVPLDSKPVVLTETIYLGNGNTKQLNRQVTWFKRKIEPNLFEQLEIALDRNTEDTT